MRESKFVEQNAEKWQELENELQARKLDPHLLRARMVQITDDLSYSRTFYKNRSVRIYLNGLAQQIYNNIYKNKKNFFKSLGKFYSEDIPKILYHSRKELLVAFLLLLLSMAIGAFSTARDPNFASSILGDGYVEMTKENIKDGDPFGVYKSSGPMEMFVMIALNNLKVAFIVFLFGLLASYGSLAIMIQNGIMLGTFMYFFYSRNLGMEFNLTVWMHGSIEILSMVIETVAGMLLGRGLIYPGTLSRTKAFSVWGKRGAMLFMSTVPFIILAAFIESYLTRHTEMPNLMRGTFILLSCAMMVFYFVYFPLRKFWKQKDVDLGMPELEAESALEFKPEAIYSGGAIFLKSVQVLSKGFGTVFRNILFISLAYTSLLLVFWKDKMIKEVTNTSTDLVDFIQKISLGKRSVFEGLFEQLRILFNVWDSPAIFLMSSLWMAFLVGFGIHLFNTIVNPGKSNTRKLIIISLIISLLINGLFMIDFPVGAGYVFLLVPMGVFVISIANGLTGNAGWAKGFAYLRSGFGRLMAQSGTLWLMFIISLILVLTPIYYIYVYLLEMNVDLSAENFNLAVNLFVFFSVFAMASFILLFMTIQAAFLAYTLKEITDAEGLKKSIEEIGRSRKAYGIETE